MNNDVQKKITVITILALLGTLLYVLPSLAVAVQNPLGQGVTIPQFAGSAIQAVLGVIGAAALAAVTYGGFLWMTSAGRPDKVQKGRTVFIWSFFGLLVIFGSYAFTTAIFEPVADVQLTSEDAGLGPQNGCEERGADWACINTFCNTDTMGFDEYNFCVNEFNETNSNRYTTCVPGGPLCGTTTELCCNVR